jgi:hypothetical protein
MKEIFLLKLKDYDNDSSVYWFDNKEWFDWILDWETNPTDPTIGTYRSYKDRYVPDSIVDYACSLPKYVEETDTKTEEEMRKRLYAQMSPGSYENDKAIILSTILSYDDIDHTAPSHTKELIKWLKKNDYDIIDEYEGLIY